MAFAVSGRLGARIHARRLIHPCLHSLMGGWGRLAGHLADDGVEVCVGRELRPTAYCAEKSAKQGVASIVFSRELNKVYTPTLSLSAVTCTPRPGTLLDTFLSV